MLTRLKQAVNLARNMGWLYVAFRCKHELLIRSGLFKKKFPVNPTVKNLPKLADWHSSKSIFFFEDKDNLQLLRNPNPQLEQAFIELLQGKLVFFDSLKVELGEKYDWTTNPINGYKYDQNRHWSEIMDFSKQAGDIKYVWEKSRFTFLYTIIRYDYHFTHDCSEVVIKEILSWIDHNPINCGPNYRCSQEISLRILNWIFALNYYKKSDALTESIFQKIMHHVYWQVKHVHSNIHFSRIAVRNNHAITETLGLYLFGILLPFFPEAAEWRRQGKKWFEEEIAYQVYSDGTYLQFSMNYHRVVVQLLTWGIRLSELNNEVLAPIVKHRAKACLRFLLNSMSAENGNLPNYGANDGALFFPLNDQDSRDYRPQLDALSAVLHQGIIQKNNEDQHWYGVSKEEKSDLLPEQGMLSYPIGGFYMLNEIDAFTFIRCGNHRDRPSQADNLHLDLWIQGKNILGDGGSYKYNTSTENLKYFFGTSSHNTVMLGDYDQMKKGQRFIWYSWTQAIKAGWKEYENYYEFKGAIKTFQHVNSNIIHTRTVLKFKNKWRWEVRDEVDHNTSLPIHQLWHPMPIQGLELTFTAHDKDGKQLHATRAKSWHSSKYGLKEEREMTVFSTATTKITTIIEATGEILT